MPETVLVTGAGGTTGSALVSELTDAGVHVRAGVHSRGSAGDLPDTDAVDVVEIDLADPATLGPAVEGVDRVYLLTPFVPDQTSLVENVVDAAVSADVDHLVRHSALGAGSDDPPYSLAANHTAAEELVESSGIDYTHVRPTAFMQNLLGEADSISQQGAIYNPVGEPVAYVDARDVARVAATVLSESGHRGEAYPVTGPEAVTWSDVADVLSEVLDRDVSHVQVSMDDARAGLEERGMPAALVTGYVGLLEWFDAGGGAEVYSTVEDLTGTSARSVRQFVEDHASAFE